MLGRFPIGALVLTLACASEEVELFELPSLAELPTPHLVEAATPLLAAARKTPEDPKALGRLAQVFEVASIWTPAERLYTRAAELDPSSEAWNYHAALCMQRRKEHRRVVHCHRCFRTSYSMNSTVSLSEEVTAS